MNVKEACKVLGIPDSSSKEDAKKAFRKLAAKYHPDINKDSDAEDQFKRINEAFRVIDTGQSSTREEQAAEAWQSQGGWPNIQDFFNINFNTNGRSRKQIRAENITIPQTLTFKEAVTGTTKDIKYKHNVKCSMCNGLGQSVVDNGCELCHGAGRIITQNGMGIIDKPCSKCRGNANRVDCSQCKTNGFVNVETAVTVNIPPGATNNIVLNCGPRGNYMGDLFGTEQNSQLSLLLSVTPQTGLSIQNNDVISEIKISLLDAFRGCAKTVPTIDGDKEIEIPKLIKNKEEITLPNLGVGRKGKQIVIINVNYPKNIDSLIEVLNKE